MVEPRQTNRIHEPQGTTRQFLRTGHRVAHTRRFHRAAVLLARLPRNVSRTTRGRFLPPPHTAKRRPLPRARLRVSFSSRAQLKADFYQLFAIEGKFRGPRRQWRKPRNQVVASDQAFLESSFHRRRQQTPQRPENRNRGAKLSPQSQFPGNFGPFPVR